MKPKKYNILSVVGALVLLPALVTLSGCAAAVVGAGAGAAGGISYTDRGAKGDIKGSLKEVESNARGAFKELGISQVGTNADYQKRESELIGKQGERKVTIEMKAIDNKTTHVEVIARDSLVKWNKDYAKEVLSKIVRKG